MRTTRRNRSTDTLPAPACATCRAGHEHCHTTLVVHADGVVECDDSLRCGGREDLHDWWLPCTDLGCGCTGDEQPSPQVLLAA